MLLFKIKHAALLKNEKFIRENKKAGSKTILDSQPFLFGLAKYYWDIFQLLNSKRKITSNGIPQAIEITEINSYCLMFEVSSVEEKEDLLFYISSLDAKFLEEEGKKRKKLAAAEANKHKGAKGK